MQFPSVGALLLAAAVIVAAPGLSFAGAVCGPGGHWVDTCAGGVYDFTSTSTVAVQLDLDGNGSLETNVPFLQLTGTTQVFLGAGAPHTIPTELVSILETGSGVTLRAGDGIGNLLSDGPLYSPGHITEQGGNPFLADSFFDVFFQIDIGTTLSLHNQNAMQVECLALEQAPPNLCRYNIIGQLPLQLFDPQNVVRGLLLATPPDFSHHVVTPTPEPATWVMLAAGVVVFGSRRRWR